MNRYLIKKFFKEMRIYNLCFLGLLLFSLSYEIPKNMPEIFPFGEIVYKFLSNVALSIVSAYLFFIAFSYFPEKKDELEKINYLEHRFLEILTRYLFAYDAIFNLGIKKEILENELSDERSVISNFEKKYNKLKHLLEEVNLKKIHLIFIMLVLGING